MSDGPLHEVSRRLRAEGGLIAEATDPAPAVEGDLEFLLEAIREGELLHYGSPRVVRTPDRDLALLAGDRLYALGLAELAERGDIHATAVLADVISACARAHAAGDPAAAEAAWAEGLRRLTAR